MEQIHFNCVIFVNGRSASPYFGLLKQFDFIQFFLGDNKTIRCGCLIWALSIFSCAKTTPELELSVFIL